jgi:hypothetical protein
LTDCSNVDKKPAPVVYCADISFLLFKEGLWVKLKKLIVLKIIG